jgi:hypothetical protein
MPLATATYLTTPWVSAALDRLAAAPCGYHAQQPSAAEPSALAALALIGAGRLADAQVHLDWLATAQTTPGSIAPFTELTQSAWPTPLAILATTVAELPEFSKNISGKTSPLTDGQLNAPRFKLSQASQWLLTAAGNRVENSPNFGLNGQLVGWPWVIGTFSWQEPTAWSVLALKAVGLTDHPRTREGVQMLVDRLISTGGCNYGNTVVLGQQLRPQVEPTGITLLALAGEQTSDPRIELSVQYLTDTVSAETTPISLSYGLLGLTAHNRRPAAGDHWLEAAYRHTLQRDASPLVLALLVLAAQGNRCPLIKRASTESTTHSS